MNIFSEFFYAIIGVKKYPRFLQNKGGKVFFYIMFAVLVYTALANAKVIPETKMFVEELKGFIEDKLPYFELKNGELYIEEGIYLDDNEFLLSVDSEYGSYINQYNKSEWMQMLAEYDNVIMMDASTILIKDDGQIEIGDHIEFLSINNDILYEMADYAYWIIAIYLILAYICNIFLFLFGVLIIALIGMIIDSFIGCGLTFGQLFKLSVYSKTCMLLVKALIKLFSVRFSGLFVIVITVSGLYLGCALSYMKNKKEQDKRYNEPVVF